MALPLIENAFKLAEYERHVFAIQPEAGVTVEDIIKPEYWSNVAKALTQGALIEARAKDGAYFAQLYVANVDKRGLVPQVRIVVLQKYDLNAAPAKVAKTTEGKLYKVVWRGDNAKHTVTLVASNEVVKDGFPSKKDAEDWIEQKELGLTE